ncbi:TetR/AcrR family transcriptional regulator [Cumulibacter soli]|uniref:TetR/AcrR family transcriptional regulator n=1 Tax=Cumulibacter soli TaxID=2546344 RepID=UPI001067677A|nr:TetR/AcrR family transcriptional regulator [Cumulibacter soli]
MPKQVDHRERREAIAHALWRVVEARGASKVTMREVARESGVSLGQLQHYFSSRAQMLTFAMEYAADQTSRRVSQSLASLDQPPHPREVLRIAVIELLPLQPDSRVTSRMNAAYVLEALHDPQLREQVGAGLREGRSMVERVIREAMSHGYIDSTRDPVVETDLIMGLSGFASLIELNVVQPRAVFAAIDHHLDQLFAVSTSP